MDSGFYVYQIKNTKNGKVYVGSTVDVDRRWCKHRRLLRSNRHPNGYLQNAWNKHGEQAFSFLVTDTVNCEKEMISREQYYLDTLDVLYNLSPTAGSTRGVKLSQATRGKMSQAMIGEKNHFWGKTHSPEVRERLAEARRNTSKEQRERLAELIRGENNPGFKKGENHRNAILTERQVREIKQLLAQGGMTQRVIAGEYGVSKMAISDINRGARWKHVG